MCTISLWFSKWALSRKNAHPNNNCSSSLISILPQNILRYIKRRYWKNKFTPRGSTRSVDHLKSKKTVRKEIDAFLIHIYKNHTINNRFRISCSHHCIHKIKQRITFFFRLIPISKHDGYIKIQQCLSKIGLPKPGRIIWLQ